MFGKETIAIDGVKIGHKTPRRTITTRTRSMKRRGIQRKKDGGVSQRNGGLDKQGAETKDRKRVTVKQNKQINKALEALKESSKPNTDCSKHNSGSERKADKPGSA
ncbi:MAG: hypothetical protein IPN33_26590 [Saprospiraceae bacterium]|nr:hypothetical protein [Saprospiraceae bacterium]